MKLATQIIEDIRNGQADALLTDIYVDESLLDTQKERYIVAIEKFISLYGDKEVVKYLVTIQTTSMVKY